MNVTVASQITASGGVIVTSETPSVYLLVNNFDTKQQQEATEQTPTPESNYVSLLPYIKSALSANVPIGFTDSKYSNGGDLSFMKWVASLSPGLELGAFAYAGWNTNGNKLGTVIANSVVLYYFRDTQMNRAFGMLRLLEDLQFLIFP